MHKTFELIQHQLDIFGFHVCLASLLHKHDSECPTFYGDGVWYEDGAADTVHSWENNHQVALMA